MTFIALLLFLTVPLVCLQCVIVVFSDHTHFVYSYYCSNDDKVQQAALCFGGWCVKREEDSSKFGFWY